MPPFASLLDAENLNEIPIDTPSVESAKHKEGHSDLHRLWPRRRLRVPLAAWPFLAILRLQDMISTTLVSFRCLEFLIDLAEMGVVLFMVCGSVCHLQFLVVLHLVNVQTLD